MSFRPRVVVGILLVLFGFSFSARLLRVRTPEHGDQGAYLAIGSNISKGRGFIDRGLSPFAPSPEIEHPEGVRAPLYPLLLAPLASDDGGYFIRAKFLTLGISLAVLWTLWELLRRRFGPETAFTGMILLAHNAPFRVYGTELWCENLLLLFVVPALFFIRDRLSDGGLRSRLKTWFAVGCLLGLGYLTKASVQLVFGALFLALLWDVVRRKAKGADWRGFGAAVLAFLLVVGPYLIHNKVVVGAWTRDVDLKGAFWLDSGRDYWLPHDHRPGLAEYLETHSVGQIAGRFLRGVVPQGRNLLRAAALDIPGGELIGGGILLLAAFGATTDGRRKWFRFQMLLLLSNLALASWYAVIDTAPRFIYLIVPLIVLNASRGWVLLAERAVSGAPMSALGDDGVVNFDSEKTSEEPHRSPSAFRRGGKAAIAVVGLLLLFNLWELGRLAPHPPVVLEREQAVIDRLRAEVPEDGVLCMGPTHALPFYWLIDRKTVFLPDYDSWGEVLAYFDRFDVDRMLLDPQLFFRRPRLFRGYVEYSPREGFRILAPLPGLAPVWGSPGRRDFVIFRRDREARSPLNQISSQSSAFRPREAR